MNLWSVFLTGLFAGGASCAAVQGGLLVASVARRGGTSSVEASASNRSRPSRSSRPSGGKHARRNSRDHSRARAERAELARRLAAVTAPKRRVADDVAPVVGFLAGKLVSHSILGFLLGVFGSSVQMSSSVRALVQISAGLFMVLVAAHLVGVPGLGWVVPKPPARLTRLVRKSARSDAVFAPALLGFLTFLIPCGVTLSVMFLAIASGSPLWGAAVMATFVAGTSPLFAAIGYAIRRTSDRLRRSVALLSAAAVLVVGLLAINTGLILRGSSVTLASVLPQTGGNGAPAAAAPAPVGPDGVQNLVIDVRSTSYAPSRLRASPGVPAVLTLKTDGTQGCTRAFVVPSLGIQKVLPETGVTTVRLGDLKRGSLRFTCSMGMYTGVIDVA